MNLTKMKKAILYMFYMCTEYKNPLIFLKYLKMDEKDFVILKRRDGLIFKTRRNIWDYFVVNEILSKKIYSFLKSDDRECLIIDIGAHIGVFSIYIAKMNPNAKILAYEPFSENFKLLKENILLNGFQDIITPYNLAVASSDVPEERYTLYLNEDNPACNSIIEGYNIEGVPTEEVRATTLKRIFQDNDIKECCLLKLDCEQAEFDIILSSQSELENTKAICFEHHAPERLPVVQKFLNNIGFKIKDMYHTILFYCYK